MSDSIQAIKQTLIKYLPQKAVDYTVSLIVDHKVHLRISKARKTKLGDYRPAMRGMPHRISVNHNLNKYSFLITLIHEIAHLIVQEKHGFRVKPHGKEWKDAYKDLMSPLLNTEVFPIELKNALYRFLKNAKASSYASSELSRMLRKYDENPSIGIPIEELELNTVFKTLNEKPFKILEKRRKRYKCINLQNNKLYLFDPLVQVIPIDPEF